MAKKCFASYNQMKLGELKALFFQLQELHSVLISWLPAYSKDIFCHFCVFEVAFFSNVGWNFQIRKSN